MVRLLALLFFVYSFHGFSQERVNKISGVVSDMGYPLANVNISIKGTTEGIQTDANGKYEIEARPGDELVFSYVGMKTVEIIVEDVTHLLNITMEADVEELDEVVVTKRKRKTQDNLAKDYFSDGTIINSNLGYLSPDLVAYELRVVDGKDLNTSSRDILEAIAEQLPGTIVRENPNGRIGRFLFASSFGSLRGKHAVAYEVDGILYKEDNAPVWLDIRTVLRVALIPSRNAVYGYGQIGAGGMVVINTNGVKHGFREEGGRPFDQARLRGNTYANEALDTKQVLANGPKYQKELYNSEQIKDVLTLYEHYNGLYGSSYSFVLDIHNVLLQRFGADKAAQRVIINSKELFKENPIALKALAYVYQSNGNFKKANEIYKEILVQRPNYVQSYMDLANSYRELGDRKKAVSLYLRFDYLVREGFLGASESSAIVKIMDREFKNLMTMKEKDKIVKNERKDQMLKEDFNGIRMVFEWNNSEAEFELQFVNPKGHYFVSAHSLAKDAERIRTEKLIGYSCEEFLIDESLPGTWQVNVKYLGNKSLTPSYLKTTIYQNYGSPSQSKEVKVFKLALKNVNQELFKVNNTVTIAIK